MKTKFIACIFSMLLTGLPLSAQDCEIPISVALPEQVEPIPEIAQNQLENSLERMVLANGMNTDVSLSQFVLTARINVLDKNVLPGPPIICSSKFGITLYLADLINRSKYSSLYVEVNGIGNNETKCYLDAFKRLNANNGKIKSFISSGKKRILDYYNKNYKQIIREALRKADLQQYEEAIAMLTAIPSCSAGGQEATEAGLQVYSKYRDRINLAILNQAKGIWASSKESESLKQVADLLARIDPEASCYPDAMRLMNDIQNQVQDEYKFEMREKYHDSVKIKQQSIEAMRAVGVAYGQGQQPSTTNLTWLK